MTCSHCGFKVIFPLSISVAVLLQFMKPWLLDPSTVCNLSKKGLRKTINSVSEVQGGDEERCGCPSWFIYHLLFYFVRAP